jgi:hypothetical protein
LLGLAELRHGRAHRRGNRPQPGLRCDRLRPVLVARSRGPVHHQPDRRLALRHRRVPRRASVSRRTRASRRPCRRRATGRRGG